VVQYKSPGLLAALLRQRLLSLVACFFYMASSAATEADVSQPFSSDFLILKITAFESVFFIFL